MSLGAAERVARLFVDGKFNGTAWLISPCYALTARHCLLVLGLMAESVELSFPAGGPTVRANVFASDSELDVVLLEVVIEDRCAALEERVLPLARGHFLRPDLRVGFIGYPAISERNLEAAFPLNCQIIAVDQRLPDGGSRNIYSQLGNLSAGGVNLDGLKGFSGGPAWCLDDMDRNGPYIAGIMLRVPAFDNPFMVPVSALLDWQQVRDAYARSPYQSNGPLCIEVVDDGLVGWSAPVSAANSDEIWKDGSCITGISCRAEPKELGDDLFWALVRLMGHREFEARFRNVGEWKDAIGAYGLRSAAHLTECATIGHRHSLSECISEFSMSNPPELAETIHAVLDRWILGRVNLLLIGVLNGSRPDFLGYPIDIALSERMLRMWQEKWLVALQSDASLLRTVLVRLASHDETSLPNGPLLARVGKGLGPEYKVLLVPCLFALALAVSGVELVPANSTRGNLSLVGGSGEGHACGCDRVRNKVINLCLPHEITWGAALVLLPLMQEPFLGIYKKHQPMRQGGRARPRVGERGLPPVIVSSDSDFLNALGGGEAQVLAHVRGLQDGLAKIVKKRFGVEEAERWKQRLRF
jgi:hypothetical protein